MLRYSLIRFCVLVLVGCAWVGVGLSGPHLHLCFDGLEPRCSLHGLNDPGHHVDALVDRSHQDIEIDLARDVVPTIDKLELGLFVAVLLFLALICLPHRPRGFFRPALRQATSHSLRPPVRGPPLANSR